jgi:2-amino-4-hydroxy-6-hydroxymethyldihydropteridine diphosphokinase
MKAYISLGSNIGDRRHYLQLAVNEMRHLPKTSVMNISSAYQSDAVTRDGHYDEPYLNAVLEVDTGLLVPDLFRRLKNIETHLGRVRHKVWGPRTLDLDLLSYGDLVRRQWGLELPHPEIRLRDFILLPIKEINPQWRHPRTRQTPVEMLEELAGLSINSRVQACCGSFL